MLDSETKRHIDNARDVLVGKVPDPKAQIEMITIALIYKFMDDMDKQSVDMGGKPSFFTGQYKEYAWTNLMDIKISGKQRVKLYSEALEKMPENKNLPQLFRDILRDAYLSFNDPETLNLFLKEIAWFNYEHSENLGDAFEYLLSIMSSQGDAGQFRTPRHIIDFMVDVIAPEKNETILDPACGTAGFLISAYNYILNANTKKNKGDKMTPDDRKKLASNIVGYDISPDMVRLSRVNMYLHGFTSPKIFEYDTLTSEERWNDNFDVILANPPFMTPKGGIRPHKKFAIQANRSEVLFVDYFMEHMNLKGRAAVIVPEGIIFQSANAYKSLRKKLVEQNYLWAVISLPTGVFNPYAGVKTSILFMDRDIAKKVKDILFVKVSNDGFDLGAQRREIEQNDLPVAEETMEKYIENVEKGLAPTKEVKKSNICSTVAKSKLAENEEYNLSADRYITEEVKKNIKYSMMKLKDLCEFSNGLWKSDKQPLKIIKILRNTNFTKNGFLKLDDVAELPVEVRLLEKKKMEFGDILLEKSGGGPTQPVGRVVYFNVKEGEYSFSNFTSRIRVLNKKQIEPKFLWSILNYMYLSGKTETLQNQTSGIRNLDFDRYKNITIPVPPLEIQQEIVVEIEDCQKIIDGARQVVENWKPKIDIDPSWPIMKLGEVCDINPKKAEVNNIDNKTKVSFLPMEDIKQKQIYIYPLKQRQISEVYKGYTYFKENDVLVAKVTPCFENGKSGIAKKLENGIGFGSSELHVIRPNHKIIAEFIYPFISSESFIINGKNKMTGTGGLQRVPADYIAGLFISVPSVEIQHQIAKKIEAEQKSVDSCREMIRIYEDKIKLVIAKVWV